MIDGDFSKWTKHKKKVWPKFPVNIGNLTILNAGHACLLGKEIYVMSLGEVFKRVHDPVRFLHNLFAHEHAKFQYVDENEPDDSMMRGASNFQEVIRKISEPEAKSHQYIYEKDLKRRILLERANKLELKQDLDREKKEQEERDYLARSAVVVAARYKDNRKGVLRGPCRPSLCRMEDTLDKGVELYLIEKEKREK